MPKRDGTVWKVLKKTQHRWDRVKFEAKRRLDRFEPLALITYRTHGGNGKIRVMGRLIEDQGVDAPGEEGGMLPTLAHMIHRFESDEIPDALIVARFDGAEVEDRTDHEGFFDLTIEPESALESGWLEVEVELLESAAGDEGITRVAEVLVPSARAEFGVISDLDDTVLETRATELLTKLRLVLSKSARERTPMPGSTPLYQMLETGPEGDGQNPFFYVSRSGWGLYDVIQTFLDEHGLPKGPIYLQDIALIEAKSPELGSEHHKRDTIHQLLDDYPDLPFVLIGDSGQDDPEIYLEIVKARTDRIRAVLVRDVTPPERDREVRGIIQEIEDIGVPAAAAESSVSMARAAADFGLIPHDAIGRVRKAMVQEEGGR